MKRQVAFKFICLFTRINYSITLQPWFEKEESVGSIIIILNFWFMLKWWFIQNLISTQWFSKAYDLRNMNQNDSLKFRAAWEALNDWWTYVIPTWARIPTDSKLKFLVAIRKNRRGFHIRYLVWPVDVKRG